ncbi:MAG: TRAP transporter substrate-binding protein DctP [Polyangiaceae bacterium]|nr:TRAP transporter substrate-binding protein DctP [Polyangiaceae bacterium]
MKNQRSVAPSARAHRPVSPRQLRSATVTGLLMAATALPIVTTSSSASAKTTLRIATLVPKASSWGKVLKVWAKATKKISKGDLELKVYYNAVQGGEKTMVAKLRTNQLDGAELSLLGLSMIDKNVRLLASGGFIKDWATMDRVRNALTPQYKAEFKKQGYALLSWTDAGIVYPFSTGVEPRRPKDLIGKKVAVFRGAPEGNLFFEAIGGAGVVPVTPFEVLPQLRSGNLNYVTVPAMAAEQLQWTPYLDNVVLNPMACGFGGTMMRQAPLDELPADLRSRFLKLQDGLQKYKITRNRAEDDASLARVTKKLKVIKLTPAELASWKKVGQKVRQRMSQGLFSKTEMQRVARLAGVDY